MDTQTYPTPVDETTVLSDQVVIRIKIDSKFPAPPVKVPRAFTETPSGRPYLFDHAPDVGPALPARRHRHQARRRRPGLLPPVAVGRFGKRFMVLTSFRTMIPDSDKKFGLRQAKENDQRITRVGRILRGCGMDELPQIINILRGEMSFVGPRALGVGDHF